MTTTEANGWQTSEAGQALQAQLTDEMTLLALSRLLNKVEALEESVNAIAEAPAMLAMVTDMADEAVGSAAARGIIVEERLKTGLAMAEKLTAPENAAKLDQLLALSDQIPMMMALVGDMTDEVVARAAARGVNVEDHLKAGVTMAEKLTAPENVAKIDQLLDLADQAPDMVAMAGDMVDDVIGRMRANGIDINQRLQIALKAAERLTSPAIADALIILTDPTMINLMGKLSQSLKEGMAMPQQKIGFIALFKAIRDPDIQRGLNLLLNFGRAFGRKLS